MTWDYEHVYLEVLKNYEKTEIRLLEIVICQYQSILELLISLYEVCALTSSCQTSTIYLGSLLLALISFVYVYLKLWHSSCQVDLNKNLVPFGYLSLTQFTQFISSNSPGDLIRGQLIGLACIWEILQFEGLKYTMRDASVDNRKVNFFPFF